jgi:hypothetical protein
MPVWDSQHHFNIVRFDINTFTVNIFSNKGQVSLIFYSCSVMLASLDNQISMHSIETCLVHLWYIIKSISECRYLKMSHGSDSLIGSTSNMRIIAWSRPQCPTMYYWVHWTIHYSMSRHENHGPWTMVRAPKTLDLAWVFITTERFEAYGSIRCTLVSI